MKASGVKLKNTQTPGDDTLARGRQEALEHQVRSITGALVLLGLDLVDHGAALRRPTPQLAREKARGVESLADGKSADLCDGEPSSPIYAGVTEAEGNNPDAVGKVHRKLLGVLGVGTVIRSVTQKYEDAAATVEDTGIRYDGQLYGSLSAAAKAATGYDAVDGWSFWSVRDESGQLTRLKDIRDGRATIAQVQRGTKGRKAKPAAVGKVHRKLLDVVGVGTAIESVTHRYEGAAATVEDTGIRYGGTLYGSLSAAAKAATGHDAVDGWSFWGVRDESGRLRRLKDIRDE